MNEVDYAEPADISTEITISEPTPRFMGTYSYVYIGRYRNEVVAIKVLKLVNQKTLHAMRRKMRRERDLWAALRHPNIVQLYGYAEDNEMFGQFGALISPWYPFGDGGRFLRERGHDLTVLQRSKLWGGVIAGVHYLHTYTPTIVHGDLKPGNILVDNELNPKICDFGLSRILLEEESTGFTTTSEHTGTERYLAYELVISDDMCLPTTATDVFALGCIGLEFIWGELPHAKRKNNVRGHIFQDIRNGVPPADRPDLPNSPSAFFWDLLQLCWMKNETERPDTSYIISHYEHWDQLLREGPLVRDKTDVSTPLIHENDNRAARLLEDESSKGKEVNLPIKVRRRVMEKLVERVGLQSSPTSRFQINDTDTRLSAPTQQYSSYLPHYNPTSIALGSERVKSNGRSFSGNVETTPEPFQKLQLYIPTDIAGSIIGKGGSKINQIRELSACQIRIMDADIVGGQQSSERLVVITGQPRNIQLATQLLHSRLEEEKRKPRVSFDLAPEAETTSNLYESGNFDSIWNSILANPSASQSYSHWQPTQEPPKWSGRASFDYSKDASSLEFQPISPSYTPAMAEDGSALTAWPTGLWIPENQSRRQDWTYGDLNRPYICEWNGCTKAYGTITQLNDHISLRKHGLKRRILSDDII